MTIEQALKFAETGCDGDSLAALHALAAEIRRLAQKHEAVIQKLSETADYLEKTTEALSDGLNARANTGYALGCREAIRLLS